MDDPFQGVTDTTIDLPVTAGQYAQLEQDRIMPDRPRVTHKVTLGPFSLPGSWVVTSTRRYTENGTATHWVTLSRLED